MLLGVDVGGTFTDAVLLDEGERLHAAKVPSTPGEQWRGVLAAVALVLERAGARPAQVASFAHGMTVATNALLEGRLARTALIATAGFTDVIELGRQARARLYDLCAAQPEPIVPAELRFAAPERIGPHEMLLALDPDAALALADEVARAAPQAVAVALLHSYADPTHEQLLARALGERLPHAHLSLSSDLVGTFREFERTATTALDAALSPLLAEYLERLLGEATAAGLPAPAVMQSSGGLTSAERAARHAALTVLSGPAGGVGGALLLAEAADEPRLVCFDMGGTSCDVCVVDGLRVPETAERVLAGRPLALPALDIHTVGAGGGSLAWRDAGGALRVGPASAGAAPGPACYGRGGTKPTVTDANLLLGRLPDDAPLAGEVELDRAAAEQAVATLAGQLGLGLLACAEGIVRVAEAEMLGALRLMTVERGVDPRDFALLPFGGAGPLHAAALAEQLGMTRILCPRASGVLSALGLAAAAPRHDVSQTVLLAGESLDGARLDGVRRALLDRAARTLHAGQPVRARVRYELRYRGQSFELPVEEELAWHERGRPRLDPEGLREAFARAHERRYGYRDAQAEVELVNMRASVWGRAPRALPAPGPPDAQAGVAAGECRRVIFDGAPRDATLLRGELAPGLLVAGPALCTLPEATLLVPPGWAGEVDIRGNVRLQRRAGA